MDDFQGLNSKALKWGQRYYFAMLVWLLSFFESRKHEILMTKHRHKWEIRSGANFLSICFYWLVTVLQRHYMSWVGALFRESPENVSGPKSNIQVKELPRSFTDYRDDFRKKGPWPGLPGFLKWTFISLELPRLLKSLRELLMSMCVACSPVACLVHQAGPASMITAMQNFQPARLAGVPAS